ncbi:tRNA glutamyl-Q(34) synthetase GluQRS [Hylemonella sp. W303a]|uniref:tRNA glutamyl-Q(34) synthetase GluQRS n=1 Tax=Hylemonella sp. W303a TaxID=3389873 RepID=UPI00396B1FA8
MSADYIGRFAPSPTGLLHAGSLVAALASWLDARAHGGRWLVRIEDVDQARCLPGVDELILQQLALCGLRSDDEPLYQSRRERVYERVLDALAQRGRAYPCTCSRRKIEQTLDQLGRSRGRHGELVYPGTCRPGPGKPAVSGCHPDVPLERNAAPLISPASPRATDPALGTRACAWRLRVPAGVLLWEDRRLGAQAQDVATEVGDFVLKRADGYWAYQLAVTVDDVAQGVTHIVRGEDLAENTPRQIVLLHALGYPTPNYLHTPLVLGPNGEKLSKQNGAEALDLDTPTAVMAALNAAAQVLGLSTIDTLRADRPAHALAAWVSEWKAHWCPR